MDTPHLAPIASSSLPSAHARTGRIRALALALACATVAAPACVATGDDGDGEALGAHELASGHYDLRASYQGDKSQVKGWIVEWQIPEVLNPGSAAAVGQWFSNLESGVYRSGGVWRVYFFGDDSGLDAIPADCDPMWDNVGAWCNGPLALAAGARVQFKYETCSGNKHEADVNGNQFCLYVDVEDGYGWRFLAQENFNGDEMYTHDVEWWDDLPKEVQPIIPCSAPTRMLQQQIEDTSGAWKPLTGASTWKFDEAAPYHFENQELDAYPASWDSCTSPIGAGNYNVRWSDLQKLQGGCSSHERAMTTDCAAAYSRFCTAGGMPSGYGPISKSETEATLTCLDATVMQAHLSDWAHTVPDCNDGTTSSPACASAVNRRCQGLGYESGFGPVEHSGDDVTIACLESWQASRMQTTYSDLRTIDPACDGKGERWGGDCSFAVSEFCKKQGAKSGFGPVENYNDDVTVVCTFF